MLELKSYDCMYRGSTNQRLIDVNKSLKEGKVVEYKKYNSKIKLDLKPKRPLFV